MRLFFVILLFSFTLPATANAQIIKTAVSPNIDNSVNEALLLYIAQELNLPINISHLPFPRRLKMLENGDLDVLVGLLKTKPRSEDFIYIEPYYTKSIHSRIFILTNDKNRLSNKSDMEGKIIAITRQSELKVEIQKASYLEVNSLEQCIKLLLKGRVDAFIHNKVTTEKKLKRLNISNQIVASNYQAVSKAKVFIAISSHSFLKQRQNELSDIALKLNKNVYKLIIEEAISNNNLN